MACNVSSVEGEYNENIHRKKISPVDSHSAGDYAAVVPADKYGNGGCDRCDGEQHRRRDVGDGESAAARQAGPGQTDDTAVYYLAGKSASGGYGRIFCIRKTSVCYLSLKASGDDLFNGYLDSAHRFDFRPSWDFIGGQTESDDGLPDSLL